MTTVYYSRAGASTVFDKDQGSFCRCLPLSGLSPTVRSTEEAKFAAWDRSAIRIRRSRSTFRWVDTVRLPGTLNSLDHATQWSSLVRHSL
jgi:hypothetical protein